MNAEEKKMTGDREELIAKMEECRRQLHKIIDSRIDMTVQEIESGHSLSELPRYHPLSLGGHALKGNKPLAVRFPDGREVCTRTWKEVAAAVLEDCNSDPVMHERLMELRGKVHGRDRVILGATPDMDVPLRIDDGLYMEAKYDTETLLYVLTERVLKPVGYDCTGIDIQYCTPEQARSTPEAEQRATPVMTMGQTM